MRGILIFVFIISITNAAGQSNSQTGVDKNQLFKNNVAKITAALNKNDIYSISQFFEPEVFKFFKENFATKEERQSALYMLKGQITNQNTNQKMISGDGFQIQFTFKKDRWVIKSWDIFSAD